ncbi:MAG: thioredoxin [Candidatus Omnitrophica bacterium]|nr:thioredoxin [Candidatus Omnitrophota bacterium]
METQITSKNFEAEVMESKIPVLVDFWAPWCGPCQMIAPHVAEVAKQHKGKLKVCKLNVDEAQEIATKYTVMSIPTLMIFKDGKIMDKRVGSMTKRDIDKFLQAYL